MEKHLFVKCFINIIDILMKCKKIQLIYWFTHSNFIFKCNNFKMQQNSVLKFF